MDRLDFVTALVGAALLCGCVGAPAEPPPPCYGTFPIRDHACRGDWTGIDSPAGECDCPPQTACFDIDEELVACAVVAGQ